MATALKWLAIKSLWITVTGVVSRFGLAVKRQAGKQREPGSNPFRFSFLFKSCGPWTLFCDFVPHN